MEDRGAGTDADEKGDVNVKGAEGGRMAVAVVFAGRMGLTGVDVGTWVNT